MRGRGSRDERQSSNAGGQLNGAQLNAHISRARDADELLAPPTKSMILILGGPRAVCVAAGTPPAARRSFLPSQPPACGDQQEVPAGGPLRVEYQRFWPEPEMQQPELGWPI